MEMLHPYWRYEYITTDNKQHNPKLFSELPKKTDEEAHILRRNPYSYLTLNAFPYTAGHLLAIPYREVGKLSDLNNEERADLFNLVAYAEDLLTQALHPDGFNIGMNLGLHAGAGFPNHLHVHIVPRWANDHNFMPVIGRTHMLHAAVHTLWEQLKKHVATSNH